MKDGELRDMREANLELRQSIVEMREEHEAEKVNCSKMEADLTIAQSHIESLQNENLALVEDVERLQRIAQGLEELNKQFSDLEERQEHEKMKWVAEKDLEIGNVAKIITEKQGEIEKLAQLIEEF